MPLPAAPAFIACWRNIESSINFIAREPDKDTESGGASAHHLCHWQLAASAATRHLADRELPYSIFGVGLNVGFGSAFFTGGVAGFAVEFAGGVAVEFAAGVTV